MNLSDRIALFNSGRIEQIGSPEELYERPETLFTARFLGDSTVFLLDEVPSGTFGWEQESWAVSPDSVAKHEGVASRRALIVRPEAMGVAADASGTPAGANTASARVIDVEYMGAYRTLLLEFGAQAVRGQARVDAAHSHYVLGDEVVAWWHPDRQRVVAA